MNELINNLAGMWCDWMWPMLWQVSVLVGLVWVADLIIRRRVWPQVRYALWLLVLVKLVLPPGLNFSTSVTSGLGYLMRERIRPAMLADDAGSAVRNEENEVAIAAGESPAIEPVVGSDVPTVVEPIIAVEEVSKASVMLSWQAYVMLGWLAGVVVLAVWVAIRFWQLRGLHKGVDAVELPERLGQLVQETARKLKLGGVPKVVLSRRVASPAVFGAFRPVLLMPAGEVSQLSRKGLEHVLLHEFAHVKRGDLKVHAFWMVLQIVYWFNPVLWFVRRQLQHLRELCCDATVARLLREGTLDYRETILETGRRLLAHPVAPGMGLLGLFEDSSRLGVRLKWLEKKTWKYRGLRMVTVFAVVALMTACVLPMAATGRNKKGGIEDSVLEGPPFAAALSSGVTVELLGVCEHPSEGRQWWRPDGPVMKEAPYKKAKCEPIASRDEEFDQLREFAVRFSGPDLGKVNITFVVPAAVRLSASSGTGAGETESVIGIACSLPKFLESHEVRVGVASGEWETAETQAAGFRANITQETDSGTITWAVPSEVKGEAMIEVAHPFVEDNVRIVAEDKRRRLVTAHGSRGGGTRMWGTVRVTFGVPLSQISRFHIQRRPYEWVKFENVSLRPGVETEVRVEAEGMVGSKPRVIKVEAAGKERIDEKTGREKIKAKLVVLEEARHRVKRDLDFAERALDEVRQSYGISDLEERSYPHPITSRLNRLQEERDNRIVEASELEASIGILDKKYKAADGWPKKRELEANLEKARDELILLRSKLERLEIMVQEAEAKKRDLDQARVQYKQRAGIRDERKRMLDSLKAEIENLKIMYDDPAAVGPGIEGETRR